MYYVYILRCDGNRLYTGITTDLERRFLQHSGKIPGGAKATKINTPLRFAIAWRVGDRSEASRLEYRLKRLTHTQKEYIIEYGIEGYSPVLLSEDGTKMCSE